MKVGDLIRIRHHSANRNGKIAVFVQKRQNIGFRDTYIVRLLDGNQIPLTKEQCEVISEKK